MSNIRDYNEDIIIDKNRLDEEWVDQAVRMLYYSELLAQAQFDLDKAKEVLDVEKGKADQRVRAAAGQERITETQVAYKVIQDEFYREALHKVQHITRLFNTLKGVVAAFAARKTSLENLVKLHLNNYFANPVAPEGSNINQATYSQKVLEQVLGLGEVFGSKELTEKQIVAPTVKYAIGWNDSRKGFTAGPFDTQDEASRWPAEHGQLLIQITPDKGEKVMGVWNNISQEWEATTVKKEDSELILGVRSNRPQPVREQGTTYQPPRPTPLKRPK
jgi:hypothetical protein